MTISGIYSITNQKSGKVYIGSTKDFEARWRDHRYSLSRGIHGNPHLQASWNKYGEDTFEFGVLEYLDSLDELAKAEQFWMDMYREEGKELYNCGLAADCPARGRSQTKEANRKRSNSLRGHTTSPETRRKISEATTGKSKGLGRVVSEETRRKISEALRGYKHSEETKHNMRVAAKGRPPVSDDTKRKISEANRGKKRGPRSEEWCCKISEALRGRAGSFLGRKHTEESKRKMSETLKGRPGTFLGRKHSEESKRKMSESAKNRPPISEETRHKISEAGKARWARARGEA